MSAPARRQRGAALLAAMLTVTLVASFAAAALWQQWRAVEVETAERARIQSAWVLAGALDWSRLILREDSLARSGDGTDNLTEPWAVPLAEARLSTFLAAQRGVAQAPDASTDTTDAFLSGQITDQQALLNLRNLAQSGQVDAVALRQFARLFEYLGLPPAQLDAIARQMVQALAEPATPAGGSGGSASPAPLLPQRVEQLGWWGVPVATVAALAPYVTLLPMRTKVNLNTADPVVLWASADGLSMAQAQQLVQARAARHFTGEADATRLLGTADGIAAATHTVSSQYFLVHGQLRLGGAVVRERSLVHKQQGEARTLWRERGAPPVDAGGGAGTYNAAPPPAP
nr:type II secretion system minor pseudopilin GspK [Melaminivora sp.]